MTQHFNCIGCGVPIQIIDKKALGYAPKASIDKAIENDSDPICQRCFRLKHYNEIQDVDLTSEDFLAMLNSLSKEEGLIVNLIDIFDFHGSWIPGLKRIVGNKKIILVANKVDLLPKSVKAQKIKQWIYTMAKELGMKPDDVYLISATKRHHIKEVMAAIEHYREDKNVYVVGTTNVGKSTFINCIIEEALGQKNVITTSHFPGTTLDLIEIPLDDGSAIFDTPGVIQSHQMAHLLTHKSLKLMFPKKEIKPRVYQLNELQTLFIGGLARFDYLKGGRNAFTVYVSNDLNIHRTKLEKAEHLYATQLGQLLSPPFEEDITFFKDMVSHQLTIKDRKTDIVISGLGWITVNEANIHVTVHAPKSVEVFTRKSII